MPHVQAVLAVLLFAAGDQAQFAAPPPPVQVACPGGECPRPAAPVAPVRAAASILIGIGTKLLADQLADCPVLGTGSARRGGGGWYQQSEAVERHRLFDGRGWWPGKLVQAVRR